MNFNIAGGWFEFAEPHLTRLFAKLYHRTRRNVLSQSVERGAYLFEGRALLVVRFDLRPRDAPLPVNHVNSRVRNAFLFSSRVGRIAQTISVYRLVFGVGEEREVDCAAPVRRDLFGKLPVLLRAVPADGVEFDGFILLQKRAQAG